MGAGQLSKLTPAEDILSEFVPEGIHGFIQLQLLFKLQGAHSGKQIKLLVRLPAEPGHLDTQLPQRCDAVPGFVKQAAGCTV